MTLFYVLVLAVAVSIDSFAAGIAYGLKKIRMPFVSLALTGIINASCSALAIFCALGAGFLIDSRWAVGIGAALLITIGLFNVFQEYLTNKVSCDENRTLDSHILSFSVGCLVINIMAKPERADIDHSNLISASEAIFLGLALGFDNLVATFAATLIEPLPLYTPLALGLIPMAALAFGTFTANHIVSDTLKQRLRYLPGLLLILLGLGRLG